MPWFARITTFACFTKGFTVSANFCPPGVSYRVIGTSPRNTSTSGSTHCGIGSRATAKAVACGGWQCTTDLMSGRSFMIVRWSRISLDRLRLPPICLPSMSTMQRSEGFMKPFEIIVGVQSTSLGPSRNEMLPSLPAAKPLL